MDFYGPKPLKSIENLTLFLILGHSEKQWKSDPKRVFKINQIWSKIEPWARKGRFCRGPGSILARSEKVWFFDWQKVDQKSIKIDPSGVPGTREAHRRTGSAGQGPRGGVQLSKKSIKSIKNNVGAHYLTRRWAQGPANWFVNEFFFNFYFYKNNGKSSNTCFFLIFLPPGRRLLLTLGMGMGGWGRDHLGPFGNILGPF